MSIHTELGALLREARESKEMAVEALAAESGLPARYVTALEEGRFDDLPDMAYARMYFFNCARTLGMPADELKTRWPQSTSQTVVPLYESARIGIPWKPVVSAAAVLLVVWFGYKWIGGEGEASTSGKNDSSGLSMSAPNGAGVGGSASGNGAPGIPSIPLPDPIHQLVLKATEKLWVVIEADGDTVVARVIEAGRIVEVEAKTEFVLTVGRPQAVLVVLDGRRVDLPERDGGPVVRHRLLASEMEQP